MADPMEAIQNMGQKVLALPTDLLSVGARRMNEDMGMMSAKIQDLGTALVPPTGMSLPQLPGLPGMGATESAAPAPAATRSEKVQGVRTTRKTSYLKV